jgi:hypothetical protein
MALRRQDTEADLDIASVLGESALLPLDSEIDRVESILDRTYERAESRACIQPLQETQENNDGVCAHAQSER